MLVSERSLHEKPRRAELTEGGARFPIQSPHIHERNIDGGK